MTDLPVADDVTVADLEDDPYPIYARLRREAPVCWVPAVGLWFITRWADVVAAGEDAERFPASMPGSPLDRTLGGVNVLTIDGEEHERMRAPMEGTLRPKLLEQHAPATVERVADEMLRELAPRGEAELMSAFCEPFAVLTLAEVIGLPPVPAATLMRWFHELAAGTSNYEGDPAKQAIADATSAGDRRDAPAAVRGAAGRARTARSSPTCCTPRPATSTSGWPR